MLRAAAYCRFSSDNQRDESIDAQVRAIKEYCSRNDLTLVKIYADEAKSATSDERESFLRMIEDSDKGIFDAIIVHKLDRFSRNKYDSAIYKKRLKDNNIKLISVLERLDGSPESIILESMLEGMAEYFSKNLAREVMKGLKENALKCLHTGGIPPTGYDVTPDKTYVINEAEANIVKRIFDLYLAGNGYAGIAQELNNSGYRSKRDKLFVKNSIRDILLNEKYTGVYIYNRRLSKKDNHKYKDEAEIIRVEDGMPQIISKEDFERAQAKLRGNKRGPRANSKRYYLLTGKAECGVCGGAYGGASYTPGRNGKKYPIYSCSHFKSRTCNNKNIRQDHLENYVVSNLQEHIFSDESINRIASELYLEIKNRNNNHDKDLKALKKKETELKRKFDIAFDMCCDGTLSREIFADKTKALEAELQDVKDIIAEYEIMDYGWIEKSKIKEFLQASRKMLDDDDPKIKRKTIELFVDKIKISPESVEVTYMVDFLDRGKVGGDKAFLTISLSITKADLYNK